MNRIGASGALLLWLCPSVSFAWDASVEGPDVFDKTKVIASEMNFNEGLIVQCDSSDDLLITYAFRKKEFEEVSSAPATLLIKFGDGSPVKLDASLRAWNDNFAGVVVSGRTPENIAVLKAIKDSKGKIQIGAEVNGTQFSAAIGSRGSTKAMETALSKCKLTAD